MLDAIVLKNHSKKPLKWVYKFCRNFELRKIFVVQLIFTHVYCFVLHNREHKNGWSGSFERKRDKE